MKYNPKDRLRAYVDHRVLQSTQRTDDELRALTDRVNELNHFVRHDLPEFRQRIDAWGEELAKLGHLGHERANLACEDAAYARRTVETLVDSIATVSTEMGLRLTRLDERMTRTELGLAERRTPKDS